MRERETAGESGGGAAGVGEPVGGDREAADIVRALAASDPRVDGWCFYCYGAASFGLQTGPLEETRHVEACPWRRAVEWVSERPEEVPAHPEA